MDTEKKKQDPTLVCTCNDLYIEDIQEAIDAGLGLDIGANSNNDDYLEIMQYNNTFPRCGECHPHIEELIQATLSAHFPQSTSK